MHPGHRYAQNQGKRTRFCQGVHSQDPETALCSCLFGLFLNLVLGIAKHHLVLKWFIIFSFFYL